MSPQLAYANYWRRKQLTKELPAFPRLRWWRSETLSDSDRVCFQAIQGSESLLDFGAGDLRVMRKFLASGYAGEYHTLDIGDEYSYTYQDLDEVRRPYGAILCLDVIEHLTLDAGLALLDRLAGFLTPGGVLVIQTPNALCSRNPMGWDMTHVQCYNVADLWSVLTCLGLETHGYRIVFGDPLRGPISRLRYVFKIWLTRILACDDCDNILMIARKPKPPSSDDTLPTGNSPAGARTSPGDVTLQDGITRAADS